MEAIVNVNHAKQGSAMQTVQGDAFVTMGLQLLRMPHIRYTRERQEDLERWMTVTKNPLMKKTQQANVSAKTRRGKIMVQKRNLRGDVHLF